MSEFKKMAYAKEEQYDMEMFERLAKKYPIMFNRYCQTEYGVPFDVFNMTQTGGTYAVELKSRGYKSEDCFIEMVKFARLRDLWREREILPVYICFYPIEQETYMWVLSEVKSVKPYLDIVVKDCSGEKKTADRFGLSFEDAIQFDKDFNIVRKPKYTGNAPKYRDSEIMDNKITINNWNRI